MVQGENMKRFIIGTDTDVGKTYYGKMLIEKGHKVIKPIETGKEDFQSLSGSDCHQYSLLQDLPLKDVNLYFFKVAASPHLASELDEELINLDKLKSFIDAAGECYVELAGGLMVPITRDFNQLDLIKSYPEASVDIVIANKLGCINHALLTIKILRDENVKINQVYINNRNESTVLTEDNERVIMKYLKSSAE